MRIIKKIIIGVSCLLLAALCGFSAFAEVTLPEGAVKGLPEKLTAMDSSGKPVDSATGEYFFLAENILPGEVYTKKVQIMNLREDKAYHVYFYIEPLDESKKGVIDLEKACLCSFYLDGTLFYQGTVTGSGTIDLVKTPYDLGYYPPGDSHTLTCSVAWVNDSGSFLIDEGHRIVTADGIKVERPKSGIDSVDGEIEFKWIFAAAVDENYDPPNTGITLDALAVWAVISAVLLLMIGIMIILISIKKKKFQKDEA